MVNPSLFDKLNLNIVRDIAPVSRMVSGLGITALTIAATIQRRRRHTPFFTRPPAGRVTEMIRDEWLGYDTSPIDELIFALVRQFKGGETFVRQIKDRMETPPAAGFAPGPRGLRNRRGVDQPDRLQ
jgi:hypothetical protein